MNSFTGISQKFCALSTTTYFKEHLEVAAFGDIPTSKQLPAQSEQ